MRILNRSTGLIKSAIVGGAAFALVVTPTAALAHGGDSHSSGRGSSQPSSQQSHKSDFSRKNDDSKKNAWKKMTCDQKQATLNQKAADAKTRYTKRLTGLNIIFGGVQSYVTGGDTDPANDVQVENYGTLSATVTTDQANATASVNGIAAPDLNCDDANAASAEATDSKTSKNHENSMNGSVWKAQKDLSTYRKDLNKLFEAVTETSSNN